MINLLKSVFVVDGQTELGALKEKMQKEYNVTINLRKGITNGKTIKNNVYGKALAPIVTVLLTDSFTKIIIVMDKEKRKQLPENIEKEVKKALIDELLTINIKLHAEELKEKIDIVVSNIMFENWILADIIEVKSKNRCFIEKNIMQENYDGIHGTGKLESLMTKPYKKTIDGPIFFKQIRFEIAKHNSESFNNFYTILSK